MGGAMEDTSAFSPHPDGVNEVQIPSEEEPGVHDHQQ